MQFLPNFALFTFFLLLLLLFFWRFKSSALLSSLVRVMSSAAQLKFDIKRHSTHMCCEIVRMQHFVFQRQTTEKTVIINK